MISLLELILYGHTHKWKIIDQRNLSVHHEFGGTSTGTRYCLQCEKCGRVKRKDLV